MAFPVTIASLDHTLYHGEADELLVPGSEGDMVILSGHEPIITVLRAGTVIVRFGQNEEHFPVGRGTLEVNETGAVVLI